MVRLEKQWFSTEINDTNLSPGSSEGIALTAGAPFSGPRTVLRVVARMHVTYHGTDTSTRNVRVAWLIYNGTALNFNPESVNSLTAEQRYAWSIIHVARDDKEVGDTSATKGEALQEIDIAGMRQTSTSTSTLRMSWKLITDPGLGTTTDFHAAVSVLLADR